jgi:hypothetical protein
MQPRLAQNMRISTKVIHSFAALQVSIHGRAAVTLRQAIS